MPEKVIDAAQMRDSLGQTRLVANATPTPGAVAERNGDWRKWTKAGVSWSVEAVVGGVREVVASGVSTTQGGKLFCLQVNTRVTDAALEPEAIVAEEVIIDG